jgi:hypothetical protein
MSRNGERSMQTTVDHLVIGAASLAEGVAFVEATLGVRPEPGGRHALMGTHNALLHLGPGAYLEVIAIDPAADDPDRSRWFALDEPATRARLAAGPALISWVARTDDVDRVAAMLGAGTEILSLGRDGLRWRIALTADGGLRESGLVPYVIQWDLGSDHPCDRLTDRGCRLSELAVRLPLSSPAWPVFEALQPGGVRVDPAATGEGGLTARIETPTAQTCLASPDMTPIRAPTSR